MRAPADLPVQPFDHVVRADASAVPVRELRRQVRGRLADPLAQAVRRGPRPPGEHAAHEMHHAPLVSRFWKHGVDGGDESRAPVAHHEPDAPESAFDHATKEPLPAGRVLPHARAHSDHLTAAVRADADGDRAR